MADVIGVCDERDWDGHRERERGAAHDLARLCPLSWFLPATAITAFVVRRSPPSRAARSPESDAGRRVDIDDAAPGNGYSGPVRS